MGHEREKLIDVEKQSLLIDCTEVRDGLEIEEQHPAIEAITERCQVYKSCRYCYVRNVVWSVALGLSIIWFLEIALSNFLFSIFRSAR